MFTSNPFAELSASISPGVMQSYVIVMILLVAGGTLFDILHKRSARYFFDNWRKAQEKGAKKVGSGTVVGLAVQTAASDVLTSAEFCNPHRRIAHLLTMYGFILYAVTTVIMVFCYPTPETSTPALWTLLWFLGVLMVCGGGYWFWFFIRADVAAEGNSPFRLIRADLFIVSLLASATFGLIWAIFQMAGAAGSGSFPGPLPASPPRCCSAAVPWSKFSHMFFKPAAALQKRVEERQRLAQQPAAAGRQAGQSWQRPPPTPSLLKTGTTRSQPIDIR